VWTEQPLEGLLRQRLADLPEPAKTNLFVDYGEARRFVTEEISGYISTVEPDLTDHGDRHLADVMGKTKAVIGDEIDYFSPYELYVLAVSILFHDVGNLHGRKEHQRKVAGVYDSARKRDPRFATERTAVLAIAGAHTGCTRDGSKNTLGELGRLPFQGNPVRGQEVAAVLRFADELAERPHRTSAYMQNHGMYNPTSLIYHRYASISDYCVERGAGRIALTYNIDIQVGRDGLEAGQGAPLKDTLQLSYSRISKLDQERRYCKYYCDLLSVFRETGASFVFYHEGQQLDVDIAPIVISDLILPGEHTKGIEEIDKRYAIPTLVGALEDACKGTP